MNTSTHAWVCVWGWGGCTETLRRLYTVCTDCRQHPWSSIVNPLLYTPIFWCLYSLGQKMLALFYKSSWTYCHCSALWTGNLIKGLKPCMDYQQRMIRIEYMQYIKMALSLGNTFLHLFHIRNMHIWILHSTAVDSATKNVYDTNVTKGVILFIYMRTI